MVREQVRGTQDRPIKTVAQASLVLFAPHFLAYSNSGVADSRFVVLPTQVMSHSLQWAQLRSSLPLQGQIAAASWLPSSSAPVSPQLCRTRTASCQRLGAGPPE